MQEFSTPMMKQYREIKKQYQDCMLFFRAGDFYELFMEDAQIGAQVLNITLTAKRSGKDGKIPMAGVPYHAVDSYLAKFVKAGYKVAICEQVSEPNKYGIVDREVVRVVTPGTVLDEKALDKKENNYIISLFIENNTVALAAADISTGFFAASVYTTDNLGQFLLDTFSRMHPVECILPESLYNNPEVLKLLKREKGINIFPFTKWDEYAHKHTKFLKKHFGVATLASFGIEENDFVNKTAAVLLGYLHETQKGAISHIKKITSLTENNGLLLDRSSMINLELFATIRDHDTRGSLLSVLDQTITAMGGRMLKNWMKKPLIEKEAIEERYDAVAFFLTHYEMQEQLRETLQHIPDIERLLARLSVNLGNARDFLNLKHALQQIVSIKQTFAHSKVAFIQEQTRAIAKDIVKVIDHIDTIIVSEPPVTVRDGGMIKQGVDTELDKLKKIIGKSKNWIIELERTERERTGIGSLKVRFNKVFGFYIEISKSHLHNIPKNYLRKQTLVNGERFITEELKRQEEIILSAEEKNNNLEYQFFLKVLDFVLQHTESIQNAAAAIAALDCISTFAYVSEKNRYTRPKLLYSGEIRIKEGRHPVVEKLLEDSQFVPNDVTLDNVSQQLLLITGPNMAGKSVFLRQVAIIVLMSQMGCFVPAHSAHISICDRIFVRSGASDVITSGLSTFMVEMVETAHILHHATKNSLIIMDEIGRGTSTYDGISIAWAVAEYLVKNIHPSPKTLFATHYHELQALEQQYPNQIKNFHMSVADEKGEPIFLHTILPGGASHSFGVAVARLAGVPDQVIQRAKELLHTLEKRNVEEKDDTAVATYSVQTGHIVERLLQKELENLDIGNMTPLEALNKLAEIKEKLKLFSKETRNISDAD